MIVKLIDELMDWLMNWRLLDSRSLDLCMVGLLRLMVGMLHYGVARVGLLADSSVVDESLLGT